MAIHRIQSAFNISNTDRLVLLYGISNTEKFISDDLVPNGKEEAIFKYLQSKGYRRIIFFDTRDRFYCYDEESWRLAQSTSSSGNNSATSTRKNHNSNQGSVNDNRPLGGASFLRRRRRNNNNSNIPNLNGFSLNSKGFCQIPTSSSDTQIAGIVDSYIRDNNTQTAVIVKFMDKQSHTMPLPHLENFVSRWSEKLPVHNLNKCIFLFPSTNFSRFSEHINRSGIPLIQSILDEQEGKQDSSLKTIVRIGKPEIDEIKRIVQYFRLTNNLIVNWRELNKLTELMERCSFWLSDIIKELRKPDFQFNRFFLGDLLGTVNEEPNKQLENLIGLGNVKKQVKEQIALAKVGGKMEIDNRLHLTFEGNPGTGKTTIARLVAEIYQDEGVLRRGHLIEADREVLVSNHVGGTAIKTKEIIEQARGGVLFIDEAYALGQSGSDGNGTDSFGQEAINTLLKGMEDYKDDLCVIFAGYPKEMESFLNTNSGLKRRIGSRIIFEDYSPNELYEIYELKKKLQDLNTTSELDDAFKKIITCVHQQRDKNFGNAGEVEKILSNIIRSFSLRCSEQNLDPMQEKISITDVPEKYKKYLEPPKKEALKHLQELIGLNSVKEQVKKQVALAKVGSKMKKSTRLHLTFEGNPGTGKTTVARLVAEIYKDAGVLRRGHLVEVDREALVAGHVGQTAPKTKELIERAKGGVLFIDEAYALGQSGSDGSGTDSFGREAINTLIKGMEDYKDDLCVIFAGYPKEMESFLNTNSGLKRRIGSRIIFEDYSPNELYQIYELKKKLQDLNTTSELDDAFKKIITCVHQQRDKNFGNAGEVEKIISDMIQCFSLRCDEQHLDIKIEKISIEDIPDKYSSFYKNQEIESPKPKTSTQLITTQAMDQGNIIKKEINTLDNEVKDNGINLHSSINTIEIDEFIDSLLIRDTQEALYLIKEKKSKIDDSSSKEEDRYWLIFLDSFWNYFQAKISILEKIDFELGTQQMKKASQGFESIELTGFDKLCLGLLLYYDALSHFTNSNLSIGLEKLSQAKEYFNQVDKYQQYFEEIINILEADHSFLTGLSLLTQLDFDNGLIEIHNAARSYKKYATKYYHTGSSDHHFFMGLAYLCESYSSLYTLQGQVNNFSYDYFESNMKEHLEPSSKAIDHLSNVSPLTEIQRFNLWSAKGVDLLIQVYCHIGHINNLILLKGTSKIDISTNSIKKKVYNAKKIFTDIGNLGVVYVRICNQIDKQILNIEKIITTKKIIMIGEDHNMKIVSFVQNLIKRGNTQKAINHLIKNLVNCDFFDQLIMLQSRYTNLLKDNAEGIIDNEKKNIEKNKISIAILELLKIMEASE